MVADLTRRAGRFAPLLIVAAVLVVTHGFWLHPQLTNQHVDLLSYWLPKYCYLGTSLRHGSIPTWLPTQFGGMPFASDPQVGWLYVPAMVLFTSFGCARALGLFITIQPILMGLGLYWFFRHEGVSRAAAVVGGLTLALTVADSSILLEVPFAGMLAWMAMTLAGASGWVHARTTTARLGWLAFTGFALSQVAAAHLTDGLVVTLMVVGVYLLARTISQLRSKDRTPSGALIGLVGPFAVFPLLAAAILLPHLELIHRTSIGYGYEQLARIATSLSGRFQKPPLSPGAGVWWGTALARGPAGYAGAVGLLLIPTALLSRRWRAPVVGFAALGLVGWVLSLQPLVYFQPVRRVVLKSSLGQLWLHSPYRFEFLVVVAVSALAGYGFQAFLDRGTAPWPKSIRWIAVTVVPVIVVFALWPLVSGGLLRRYAFFALGTVYATALLLLVARGRRWAVPVLVVALAAELTAAGLVQQRGPTSAPVRDRFEKQSASGLDHSFPGYHTPFLSPRAYLTPGPIGRTLQGSAESYRRYLSFDPAIAQAVWGFLLRQGTPDWPAYEDGRSVLFGIPEIQGYSPVQLDRYWRLVRRTSTKPIHYNAATFQSIDPAVLRLFGVGWLIERAGVTPPRFARPVETATEGDWVLYRLADGEPRASLVTDVTVVPGGAGLDTVLAAGFDPARRAIVEASPAVVIPRRAHGSVGSVTYDERSPEHARVVVQASSAALVVVRNPYDVHWKATVDGRPAPVLVTDYLMQGVVVPAGHHVVDLTYRDDSIGQGLIVSALAWVVLLGAAGGLRLAARRRGPGSVAAV